ncbi:MAG: isochorismatase [Prochlorothrix sp.]
MTTPLPPHFDPSRVGEVWRVPYQQRATEATTWAMTHALPAAAQDPIRLGLLIIDAQNTFCIPEFELFVGGRSGRGAVEDNRRLCEFIYRNLGIITEIIPTLDTHTAMQIFHPVFWVDREGNPPAPMTLIHYPEVEAGVWRANPALAPSLTQGDTATLQSHALHYAKTLTDSGKYPLTIWPYHSILGGIGHALVSAVEEACFFHTIARQHQTRFELKGSNPLTENYSVLCPEVLTGADGHSIAQKNNSLIQHLLTFDRVVIAGQAKSHCVAWTIEDLLTEIQAIDPSLAQKVYLLEDCTSPVVVPGVVDFTEQADAAYTRFATAGMHRVKSTDPIDSWPQVASA